MTRVPMGLPASLPFKNGFGSYKSPAMQARYPNMQFSQFTGAEMLAEKYELTKDELDDSRCAATSAQSQRLEARISVQRSCRCPAHDRRRSDARDAPPTKASASTPLARASARSSCCTKAAGIPRPPPARSATALRRFWSSMNAD